MSGQGKKQDPQVLPAVSVCGLMALALAVGLDFLKVIERMNVWFTQMLTGSGLSQPVREISKEVLWLAAGFMAFLLAAVLLNIPGMWRRILVWGITIALTFFWAPVLLLAAYKPEIGVVLVAVLWSGFCAMVYATNHVMPADEKPKTNKDGAS